MSMYTKGYVRKDLARYRLVYDQKALYPSISSSMDNGIEIQHQKFGR